MPNIPWKIVGIVVTILIVSIVFIMWLAKIHNNDSRFGNYTPIPVSEDIAALELEGWTSFNIAVNKYIENVVITKKNYENVSYTDNNVGTAEVSYFYVAEDILKLARETKYIANEYYSHDKRQNALLEEANSIIEIFHNNRQNERPPNPFDLRPHIMNILSIIHSN